MHRKAVANNAAPISVIPALRLVLYAAKDAAMGTPIVIVASVKNKREAGSVNCDKAFWIMRNVS
jgi:hypothetical protein